MAICFYCKEDRTLTRAHLFQKRFREAVEIDSNGVTMSASGIGQPGAYIDRAFPGDIRDMNVTALCPDCNGKWMNSIEKAAAPVFASIMRLEGFPPPTGLFRLAHWSTVVAGLSSELFPKISFPDDHAHAIRYTATGQPDEFTTHFIWTKNYLPSISIDLFRFESRSNQPKAIDWSFVLHAGPLVLISSGPSMGPRVSRVLDAQGINCLIGVISSNLVYLPTEFEDAAEKGIGRPTHAEIETVYSEIFNPGVAFIETKGRPVFDVNGRPSPNLEHSFDYQGKLSDRRHEVDLSYLDMAFGTSRTDKS